MSHYSKSTHVCKIVVKLCAKRPALDTMGRYTAVCYSLSQQTDTPGPAVKQARNQGVARDFTAQATGHHARTEH